MKGRGGAAGRVAIVGAILLCTGILGACRESGGKDELFAISGKLFEFNYRLAQATYVVTLKPLRPMVDGQIAVASFQNPAGGDPIIVKEKIWPQLPHVTLDSPPLTCVIKNKPYKVSIHIEDSKGNLLQKLDTTITSSQDQSILPDKPLVVGPIYELNPELAGHPDGRLPGTPKPHCPARA